MPWRNISRRQRATAHYLLKELGRTKKKMRRGETLAARRLSIEKRAASSKRLNTIAQSNAGQPLDTSKNQQASHPHQSLSARDQTRDSPFLRCSVEREYQTRWAQIASVYLARIPALRISHHVAEHGGAARPRRRLRHQFRQAVAVDSYESATRHRGVGWRKWSSNRRSWFRWNCNDAGTDWLKSESGPLTVVALWRNRRTRVAYVGALAKAATRVRPRGAWGSALSPWPSRDLQYWPGSVYQCRPTFMLSAAGVRVSEARPALSWHAVAVRRHRREPLAPGS